MHVAGIVLAAGQSLRLGRPKQLLDLHGEPLLRRAVRNALAARFDEVLLVLGHRADDYAMAVGDLGQRVVINPDYADGQSTSVRAGLAAISPSVDAVLFLLGDQPRVGPDIINAVIARYEETHAPVVMPTYGGVPANPVLFDASLFPELRQVTGDEGARAVVKRHRDEVAHVAVSAGPPPRDVDTEKDYQALLEELAEDESQRGPSLRSG